MTPSSILRATIALTLLAASLAACMPDTRQARLAEPNGRSWADPSWPRPDQPVDRDANKL